MTWTIGFSRASLWPAALLMPVMLIMLMTPAAAMAQSSGGTGSGTGGSTSAAPKKGDMSVSGSLGIANAFDNDFDGVEAIFDGTFEYHISDRISWRGMLGFASFDFNGRGSSGSADIMFVNGNIVYGWHNDNLRPYVTGGIGLYSTDPSGSALPDNGDVEVGLNCGGGLDIYVHPHWAVTVEGLFHGYTGDDPDSFLAATVGARYRF